MAAHVFQPKAPLAPADTWNALGSGTDLEVYAIAIEGPNVYVGGDFESAGGVANTTHIACWNAADSSWHAIVPA